MLPQRSPLTTFFSRKLFLFFINCHCFSQSFLSHFDAKYRTATTVLVVAYKNKRLALCLMFLSNSFKCSSYSPFATVFNQVFWVVGPVCSVQKAICFWNRCSPFVAPELIFFHKITDRELFYQMKST